MQEQNLHDGGPPGAGLDTSILKLLVQCTSEKGKSFRHGN